MLPALTHAEKIGPRILLNSLISVTLKYTMACAPAGVCSLPGSKAWLCHRLPGTLQCLQTGTWLLRLACGQLQPAPLSGLLPLCLHDKMTILSVQGKHPSTLHCSDSRQVRSAPLASLFLLSGGQSVHTEQGHAQKELTSKQLQLGFVIFPLWIKPAHKDPPRDKQKRK